ncbi:hypothetical protein L6164_019705 [Bauhinia variegata]|uniref:Uncharacterized protein n=1 Tax=Bauhinia variegata TaxID=167791 RepID=A0ACB9MSX2_BAUVA|nr:hypothetical protein L6164_019705 [Bauhinia variegata]
MGSSGTTRRPCFLKGDDGLASLADLEAGYSHQHGYVTTPLGYVTSNRTSFRNLAASSPRSGRFYDARFEDHLPHFLEACFLCKKPLGDNRDIFMYRGDTPFCSKECRQEQIEIDEAEEKNRNLSSSMKALREKEQRESSSPNKTQDYSYRRGTIAAA